MISAAASLVILVGDGDDAVTYKRQGRLTQVEEFVARQAYRTAAVEKVTAKRPTKPSRIEIGCKGGRILKIDASIAPETLKALIRSVEEA